MMLEIMNNCALRILALYALQFEIAVTKIGFVSIFREVGRIIHRVHDTVLIRRINVDEYGILAVRMIGIDTHLQIFQWTMRVTSETFVITADKFAQSDQFILIERGK